MFLFVACASLKIPPSAQPIIQVSSVVGIAIGFIVGNTKMAQYLQFVQEMLRNSIKKSYVRTSKQ